jgi:hypothetical protein
MVFILGKPGLSSGFFTGQLRIPTDPMPSRRKSPSRAKPSNPPTLNTVISPVRRCIENDAPIEVQRSIDRRAHDAILNDSGDEEPRTSPYDFCANSVKPVTSAAP